MSQITITTNHHVRELCSWNELPEASREDFDYVRAGDLGEVFVPRFFRYRGQWYDSHEFERIIGWGDPRDGHRAAGGHPLRDWDGIQTQSYFDAIVMKWARDWDGSEDFDAVVVGHAHW